MLFFRRRRAISDGGGRPSDISGRPSNGVRCRSTAAGRQAARHRRPLYTWNARKIRQKPEAGHQRHQGKTERRRCLRAELASTDRTVGLETMQLSRALRTASRGTRFARPAAMSSAAAKADGSEAFVGTKRRRARGAFETTDHATLMEASKARHDEDRST